MGCHHAAALLASRDVPRTLNAAVLGLHGWRLRMLPPLAALGFALVVHGAAAIYGGFDPLDAHSWTSFDSPIYLSIAEHGYTSYDCPQAQLDQGATACGTFGWFPLYPALIWPLMQVGLGGEAAGVVVSLVFWALLLGVVWNGLLLPLVGGERALLPALALAAVAPGTFYFQTVYPMALATSLVVVALVGLIRGRWWCAGAAGFLACAAYPGAAALVVVAGLWLAFVRPAPSWSERGRRLAIVCGLTVAGFLAVLLYAQLATGQWDGYFGVQARFHHGLHFPLGNWLDISRPRTEGLGSISLFLAFQSWLTTVMVLSAVAVTCLRRRAATPVDWLLILYALAFWLIPLCQNVVAYYRTDALLVPVVVLLARLPFAAVATLVGAATVVSAGMTLAFMQGVLV